MAVNFVEKTDDQVRIERVLISVADKKGLDILVPGLLKAYPKLTVYSTGGTFAYLKDLPAAKGLNLVQVSDYTGQPEMQGGLVKTLDFKIYLGLLSETYNEEHRADMARTKAVAIDMVVSNLYPFVETISKKGVTPEQARANIDIGGPCMVRAAAKNFLRVASLTDPADYGMVLKEIEATGGFVRLKTRYELARKAFHHTAAYDKVISDYLAATAFEAVSKCYQLQAPGK
jgi:phosphoribosylaminoimidazolecarboxamide formyltransferase / IMP cyclohydrolase